MWEFFGSIIGVTFISISCGVTSYFLWEKLTKRQHFGKQVLFTILCFCAGGFFGLMGGIPTLVISYMVARIVRAKQARTLDPSLFLKSHSDESLEKVI